MKKPKKPGWLARDLWLGDMDVPLVVGTDLFHLPDFLKQAYGDTSGYDLSDKAGLLRYVVDFVNRPEPKTSMTKGIPEPPYKRDPGHHVHITVVGSRSFGKTRLRQLLHDAVHRTKHSEKEEETFISDLRQHVAGMTWMQRLDGASQALLHHAFIHNAEQFYALVAFLLVNEDYRQLVAQCRYEPCSTFFLIETHERARGRPMRVYCSSKCRRLAHSEGSAARQNRRRAKLLLVKDGCPREDSYDAVERAFKKHPDATAKQLAEHAKQIISRSRKRRRAP